MKSAHQYYLDRIATDPDYFKRANKKSKSRGKVQQVNSDGTISKHRRQAEFIVINGVEIF